MLLLFATFTTKNVDFLYFFSTFSTKNLRFLNVNEECAFVFSNIYSASFLQINLTLHTDIVLLDISMTCFLSFVSINFSFVKHLREGVVTKSHFSHLMLNPLHVTYISKVEFRQCNRFLLFLLLSCVINRAQLTFTCSNSTIETVKVWNMFKVNNKNIRMMSLASFCCFYHYFWTYFTPLSSVPIVDFKHEVIILGGSLNSRSLNSRFFLDSSNKIFLDSETFCLILKYFSRFWNSFLDFEIFSSILKYFSRF